MPADRASGLPGQSRFAQAKAIAHHSRPRTGIEMADGIFRPILIADDGSSSQVQQRPSTAPAQSPSRAHFDKLPPPEPLHDRPISRGKTSLRPDFDKPIHLSPSDGSRPISRGKGLQLPNPNKPVSHKPFDDFRPKLRGNSSVGSKPDRRVLPKSIDEARPMSRMTSPLQARFDKSPVREPLNDIYPPSRTNKLTVGLKKAELHRTENKKFVSKLEISGPFDVVKAQPPDALALANPTPENVERPACEAKRSLSKREMKKISRPERSKSPNKLWKSGHLDSLTTTSNPIHIGNSKDMYIPRFRNGKYGKSTTSIIVPKAATTVNFGGLFHSNKLTKVKDAISDRIHSHGHDSSHGHTHTTRAKLAGQKRSNSHGTQTPVGSIFEDDEVKKMLEQSPKLQRFFGTPHGGGQSIEQFPSPHRRRMTLHALSLQEETALYSDDDHDVFISSKPGRFADMETIRSARATGLGLEIVQIAPWLEDSQNLYASLTSVTDIASPAGILTHEKRGLKTQSFMLEESIRPSADILEPPTFVNCLDVSSGPKPPNGPFDEDISGLRQHGNVMEFVEPPEHFKGGCSPPKFGPGDRTPRVDRELKSVNRHQKMYGFYSPESRRSISDSQLPGIILPIPKINIKRASTVSKRSSGDAELSDNEFDDATQHTKRKRVSEPDENSPPDHDLALQPWMIGEPSDEETDKDSFDHDFTFPRTDCEEPIQELTDEDSMRNFNEEYPRGRRSSLATFEPNLLNQIGRPGDPAKRSGHHNVADTAQLFGVSHRPNSCFDELGSFASFASLSNSQPASGDAERLYATGFAAQTDPDFFRTLGHIGEADVYGDREVGQAL